jgi:hypothetical protein
MGSRIAAWLLTSPVAFFLAGAIDIGLFVLLVGYHRLRQRLGWS